MSESIFLELFLVEDMEDFFFMPPFFSAGALMPFFADICELLAVVVVVAVSVLFAQDAKNATAIKAVMEERMDLFIGYG